jgi:tryptophan halogenase
MKFVRTITIVGGGSSAWMTAAFLAKNNPDMYVTVVDKEIGSPVGVGEGTTLAFGEFMTACGFEIDEWFPGVDATFKSAIMFPNWREKGHNIWHPFWLNDSLENDTADLASVWSKNQNYDYKIYGSMLYDTSIKNKIDLANPHAYAYHIDAGKLVTFIQSKLQGKVRFIKSEVVDIKKTGNTIDELHLKDGSVITSDLYIDCTGFIGLLKDNPKRVDVTNRLFCNTAIAGHIPYIDKNEEMHPYVISEAVDCGWVWNIPVQSRIGSGLVFNRDITDIEDAKDYFVKYWNNRVSKDKLKVLKWDPYYNEDFWRDNVVSIGLSAGFIEPLESTGLALIAAGIVKLQAKIRDNTMTEMDAERYNLDMKSTFEDCIDFVSMHYSITNRTEPFWQYVKETYKPSEKILAYAELTKEHVRYHRQAKDLNVFSGANWTCWMAQLGYPVGEARDNLTKDQAEAVMLKHHNEVEKFRFNQSRHHYTEIQRLSEFYKNKR